MVAPNRMATMIAHKEKEKEPELSLEPGIFWGFRVVILPKARPTGCQSSTDSTLDQSQNQSDG